MARALGVSGRGSGISSGAGEGVEISLTAMGGVAEGLVVLLAAGGREGLVTLFEVGPKVRVCWARVAGVDDLRRFDGIVWVIVRGCGWRVGQCSCLTVTFC